MSQDLEIKIKTVLDSANTAKSLTDIKKSLKELKSAALEVGEGGKSFTQLTTEANKLQDKLDDLKDSAKSLQGTGIEKLNSSFNLLRESMGTADLDKAKIAFKGIGSAIEAIPIFLLIEAVKALIENFDKVIDFGKKLFNLVSDEEKAVNNLTKAIEAQKNANKDLVASLENQLAILEAEGKSNSEILRVKKELLQAQIKELEATVTLNAAKIREVMANDDLTESYYHQMAAIQRKLGNDKAAETFDKIATRSKLDRAKEYYYALKQGERDIEKLKTDIKVAEIQTDKKNTEEAKKNAEERNKNNHEALLAQLKEQERLAQIQLAKNNEFMAQEGLQLQQDYVDQSKAIVDGLATSITEVMDIETKEQALQKWMIRSLNASTALSASFRMIGSSLGNLASDITNSLNTAFAVIADKSKSMSDKLVASLQAVSQIIGEISAFNKQKADERVKDVEQSSQASLNALSQQRDAELAKEGLTAEQKDAIQKKYAQQEYELKLQAYIKETEIKKKAFIQDQKLKIAQTIISTVTGAVAAFTGMVQSLPGPIGLILGAVSAAAVVAMGAIQIAKIKAQKFDAGSPPTPPTASGGSSANVGDGSNAKAMDAPNLNRIGRTTSDQEGGGFGGRKGNLRKEPIQAYVVTEDISKSQNKQAVIERRSSF